MNSGRARVVNSTALERDLSSQAIINRNQSDYQRRLAQKRYTAGKDQEIENLKSEVSQLKDLVHSLISSSAKS
jgi:hypothetical protein